MYPVLERLISFNRPKEPLVAKGFVIHSTDNPGATAQNHYTYWNAMDRQSSAHYVVDWKEIIRLIPETEIAWHARNYTANRTYLSVEMCEPSDGDADRVSKFNEVWKRTVWLVADACVRYGWSTGPNVWSHNGLRSLFSNINHTDPYDFFKKYGKTWDNMISDINSEIERIKNPPKPPDIPKPDNKTQAIELLKQAIKLLEG